jgi:hypothetical protein
MNRTARTGLPQPGKDRARLEADAAGPGGVHRVIGGDELMLRELFTDPDLAADKRYADVLREYLR